MKDDIGKLLIQHAQAWGATGLAVEHGGSHPRLVGRYNGMSFTFVYPGTAGDWRSGLNCVSNLRRILGVPRKPRARSVRPKRTKTRHPVSHRMLVQKPLHEPIEDKFLVPLLRLREGLEMSNP